MAGKDLGDWPKPEEIIKLAKEHDSIRSLARTMDKPPSSVQDALVRMGIAEMVRAALRHKKTPSGGVSEAQPPAHDVTTPEGREEYGRDAELKHLRRENKRLSEAVMKQEDFFDRVVQKSREPRRVPFIFRHPDDRPPSGPKKRDVILHISDLHYGQNVRAEDTPGGLNVYNREVFEQRLERYTEAVCDSLMNISQAYSIESVIFALCGDMCEGYGIFRGQEWHLWCDPVVQVVEVSNYLEDLISQILTVAFEECGVQDAAVLAVNGNHGTPQGRKAGAQPTTHNYDWLIYKMLEKSLQQYPFSAFGIEPGGACYFESQGNVFYMTHGETVRGWGGIPFYGLTKADARTIRMNNTVYDYGLFAHHHQNASIPIGHAEMFVNGNWVGGNNLAQFVGSGSPSQNVYIVSKDYGVGERVKIELQTKEDRIVLPTIHETSGRVVTSD